MKDPRIHLGSRGVAAVLAFLLPGAGHFYQGRRLKAAIFATCILSTFFTGLVLGEGQPVYSQVVRSSGGPNRSAQLQTGTPATDRSLGYYAQVFVGLPALPALLQAWRFRDPDNKPGPPATAMTSNFEGDVLRANRDQGPRSFRVTGQIELEPGQGDFASGTLTGTTVDGESVTLQLEGRTVLGKPVFGSPHREFRGELAADDAGFRNQLVGTIERPFTDWFQAPRDNQELDRLHSSLSQKFDIACVFTWIAGFLNVMATWDAFDGPAYGYGDEDEEDDSDSSDSSDKD